MKNCLFCKHFHFDSGSPGYSEMTPGSDMSMGCELFSYSRPKKYWQFSHAETTENKFRQYMVSAETCPDYWNREEAASDRYALNPKTGVLHIMNTNQPNYYQIAVMCKTRARLRRVSENLPVDGDVCKKCIVKTEANHG